MNLETNYENIKNNHNDINSENNISLIETLTVNNTNKHKHTKESKKNRKRIKLNHELDDITASLESEHSQISNYLLQTTFDVDSNDELPYSNADFTYKNITIDILYRELFDNGTDLLSSTFLQEEGNHVREEEISLNYDDEEEGDHVDDNTTDFGNEYVSEEENRNDIDVFYEEQDSIIYLYSIKNNKILPFEEDWS
jgi:hypothetical protein